MFTLKVIKYETEQDQIKATVLFENGIISFQETYRAKQINDFALTFASELARVNTNYEAVGNIPASMPQLNVAYNIDQLMAI